MPTAHSPKYPNLKLRSGVRFQGGTAEVTAEQAAVLLRQRRLGITVDDFDPDDADEPDPDAPPRGNASREDWAAYAARLDVDAEGLGRDDIKAAIAAARDADDDPDPDQPAPEQDDVA